MKKLTKTLSLVLVVAMVLSLCVIGASATFTDNSKVTANYNEAVGIMTDLAVVKGYPDGSFKPAGTLTRAEACVLMANMTLGTAAAAALAPTTVTFKDVPTSYWGYKYVEYCYQCGYIAGTGAGNFTPGATLTGYQWALMLMRILGYDMTSLSTGNWQINTAKVYYATDTAFSSVTISSAAMTREAATQMAYDALFYSNNVKTGYAVYKDGVAIAYYDSLNEASAQSALFDSLDSTSAVYSFSKTPVTVANGTSLASTVFGVYKNASGAATSDVYGRPANVYTTSTKAKATAYGWTATAYDTAAKIVAATPVLTYTTSIVPKTLGLTLQNSGYKTTGSINFVTNGKSVTYTSSDVASYLAGTTPVGGNGCLVEVYVNTSNVVTTIVVVNTYVGAVTITAKDNTATTNVDERTLSVTVGSHTFTANYATPGFDAVYKAATAAAAAATTSYALVVPDTDNTANGAAVSLAVPDSKTVTPTSYSTSSFATSDATYKYSKNCVGTVGSFSAQTVLVDAYGYVIKADAVATTANLAVLTAVGKTTSWGTDTYQARLVMPDGTVSEVTAAADYTGLVNTVVNYSVTSGVYTLVTMGTALTPVASYSGTAKGTFTSGAVATGVTLSLTKGVATFTFGTTFVANAQTVFVVRSGSGTTASPYTYASYTGVANVPSMSATKAAGYVVEASGVAKFVYVVGATAATTTGNAVVFVPGIASSVNSLVGTTTVTHYVGKAIVDGSIVDLDMSANYGIGVYTVKGTDAYGYVTLATPAGAALATNSVYDATGATIVINGTTYSVASDCVIYTYSASTGAITAATLSDVTANATGWFTLKSNLSTSGADIVNAIYVQVA